MADVFDLSALVSDLVREGMRNVDAEQMARAVALALLRYSNDRPLTLVRDVEMVDTRALPGLDGWEQQWSQVLSIETPIDQFPPRYLDSDGWIITATPLGDRIMLANTRRVGDLLRVSFTSRHLEETVPTDDREAVALWAAAWLAEQISALLSSDSAPTMNADSVNQMNPATQWAKRAATWRARYAALVGATGITGAQGDKPAKVAAGTIVNFNGTDTRGQQRQITRRRR